MKKPPATIPTVYYTTVSQTAKRWGVSRQTVDRHARAGNIPGTLLTGTPKIRGAVLIPTDAVRPVSRQGFRSDLADSQK